MKPPGSAMALTSSESITLMVKGTLASEFFTRFCAIRFTYSTTTGSFTNLTLFSSCMAYDLPMRISVSVEYQLPMPRPPISRVPTAFTSLTLPCFTPGMIGSVGGWVIGMDEAGGSVGAVEAGGVEPGAVGAGAVEAGAGVWLVGWL